jgi:signal transduction histidine kinase
VSDTDYDALRTAFTASVSHELRTPLARLQALLDSAELPGADLQALLAQARDEVGEMTDLVDDILFLSELEQGREVVALGETEAATSSRSSPSVRSWPVSGSTSVSRTRRSRCRFDAGC